MSLEISKKVSQAHKSAFSRFCTSYVRCPPDVAAGGAATLAALSATATFTHPVLIGFGVAALTVCTAIGAVGGLLVGAQLGMRLNNVRQAANWAVIGSMVGFVAPIYCANVLLGHVTAPVLRTARSVINRIDGKKLVP